MGSGGLTIVVKLKAKVILGLSLLLSFILVTKLVTDDELNPEAKQWLERYSQKPNLEQNVFIELIALGQDTQNPYQAAKQKYLAAKQEFNNGDSDYDKQLKYPVITGLPSLFGNDIYCTFDKPDCFEQLSKNKAVILKQLQPFENKLKKFRQLVFYTNYDFLNLSSTEPVLELLKLYKLSAIQAYYLITENELEKAATLIANLIKLERQFLQASSDVVFTISPIVHFQMIYTPLIQELHIRGFNNWQNIQSALTPLKVNEISTNRLRLQEFASSAQILKLVDLIKSSLEQSWVNHYLGKLIYKPNMTINAIFELTQAQLIIEVDDKSELYEQIKMQLERKAIASEKEQSSNVTKWTLIKNYRNISGTLISLTAVPKFLDFYEDIISLDLTMILLNALIQSQTKTISDIIDSPDFINPYNGEKPYLDENKLCLRVTDKPVCLDIKPKVNQTS